MVCLSLHSYVGWCGGGRHAAERSLQSTNHVPSFEGSSLRAAAHTDFSQSVWRGWDRAAALGVELLCLSTAPGTVSPGLAQTLAPPCHTKALWSWVHSTCSLLLSYGGEGRETGKLCSGCLRVLCHMLIIFYLTLLYSISLHVQCLKHFCCWCLDLFSLLLSPWPDFWALSRVKHQTPLKNCILILYAKFYLLLEVGW